MSEKSRSIITELRGCLEGSALDFCHTFRELLGYARYVRKSIKKRLAASS